MKKSQNLRKLNSYIQTMNTDKTENILNASRIAIHTLVRVSHSHQKLILSFFLLLDRIYLSAIHNTTTTNDIFFKLNMINCPK